MSELTLEKNRPFRVDLENVDFSNIAPDNVDKFKALVKIFDKTLNFTIAEAKEFDSFNATTEAFLNTMTGVDIGGVRTRTVEGIVNGNQLILSSGEKYNLSKEEYYIVKKEKKVQKKFEKVMEYYHKYQTEEKRIEDCNKRKEYPSRTNLLKLSIVAINTKTGDIRHSNYEYQCEKKMFWYGHYEYSDAVRMTASKLNENEVLLKDFNPDEKFYEHIYHVQLFDVTVNFRDIFKYWLHKKTSESAIMNLLSYPRFKNIREELVSFLNSHQTTMEDCRIAGLDWYKNWLLHCDTERANITPYHDNTLLDPNLGHWELYEEALDRDNFDIEEESASTEFAYARAPHLDVRETGVCAIDFGTKSTVVACRDQEERLLRVGTGDYTQAPRKEDYENPTTVYFSNLKSFLKSYAQQAGRPYTKWEDVMVSHQAAEHLYDHIEDNTTYYATFSELKQWANDKKRHQVLKDEAGHEIELIPYLTIQNRAKHIDPIELYAYYLGLYINNMTNGIYLSYILSFPVNYGKEVQEKLLESFTKGLKKSLPQSILSDTELMENFEVYGGASEPAAYAISALEQYELEPKVEGEEVPYAVFDFGGGTTDFDFGIEKKPEDGRRKFEIHQFGKGGDPYLGGENLLQLLAYTVYEDNVDVLRQAGIQIVLPKKATPFAGSELLVMDMDQASQEAHLNMRTLMRLLRPIWEEHKDYKDAFVDGPVTIDLYTKENGEMQRKPLRLNVNINHLQDVLRDHIKVGVTSFISQMMSVLTLRTDVQFPIHIFLAGNSCQSRILQEEFVNALLDITKEATEELGKNASNIYRLYPPLGSTMDIEAINGKLGSDLDRAIVAELIGASLTQAEARHSTQIDRIRTGKTGVVFGLLRSRRGGKDIKIVNNNEVSIGSDTTENTFPYYLGKEGEKRNFEVEINLATPYHQWQSFCWADEAKFELYYTDDSRALYNGVPINEVKRVHCRIDQDDVDEDKLILIKKVAIDTIEYVVADPETFTGDTSELKVYSKVLEA
jgi:hypothetical protein